MIHENIQLTPVMEGTNPYVETFLFSASPEILVSKRPLILICPGGGYEYLSAREGESIALTFNAMGYNSAIIHYTPAPATYPTSLLEVAASVKFFKDNADFYGIDADKIVLWGASAGGHLVASFATGYFRDEVTSYFHVSDDYLKPAGLMLSYPVITSGEYAHRGSFDHLLGDLKNDAEMLKYTSIENRVNEKMPPAFVWHTFTDTSVPVQNSFLLADAMRRANVSLELHIFPTGGHGLALANDITLSPWKKEIDEGAQQWVALARNWLSRVLGPLI